MGVGGAAGSLPVTAHLGLVCRAREFVLIPRAVGSHRGIPAGRRRGQICDLDRLCRLLCGRYIRGFERTGWEETCWEALPTV